MRARVTVGKRFAEILSIARREMWAAVALDSEATIAVEFDLQLPLSALGQSPHRERLQGKYRTTCAR